MAKKKVSKQVAKRAPDLSLSLADRFYIEQHGEMSIEELAAGLGKPIELVKAYTEEWLKKHPPKKVSRVRQLMDRPGKHGGVIAMNEAASMVGDDAHKRHVTLNSINRAMMDGNMELAKELKLRYEEQQRANQQIVRAKYSNMIHYIETPDDEA